MHKFLLSLLVLNCSVSFATDYSQFQEFDNQISIGYGMQEDKITAYGGGDNNISDSSLLNFEGERLLDNGIWIDLNANMNFSQNAANITNNPIISNYGFNGKVGYAFVTADQHLLLIPYGIAGINNYGVPTNNYSLLNQAGSIIANQFFLTTGVGGQIAYRINNSILIYADQNLAYNWDQTGYFSGIQQQNLYSFTSTLGVKFNLVQDLQLGIRGFYTNFQPNATAINPYDDDSLTQAQSSLGGLVSIGLTY
ncbi:MAG: hypothetical protein ORN24_00100 [Burkholderiales bacterium]|nr:hypothetical protein [Burkholderiales bacterium]